MIYKLAVDNYGGEDDILVFKVNSTSIEWYLK